MKMSLEIKLLSREEGKQRSKEINELIKNIWPVQSWEKALLYFNNWILIPEKTGAYFLINNDSQSIGITGYYIIDEKNLGLRHHGILPDQRKKGYSKKAMNYLMSYIKKEYHLVEYVYEVIPNRRIKDLVPVFQKIGFEVCVDLHNQLGKDDPYWKDGVALRRKL